MWPLMVNGFGISYILNVIYYMLYIKCYILYVIYYMLYYIKCFCFCFFYILFLSQVQNILERIIMISTTGLRSRDNNTQTFNI